MEHVVGVPVQQRVHVPRTSVSESIVEQVVFSGLGVLLLNSSLLALQLLRWMPRWGNWIVFFNTFSTERKARRSLRTPLQNWVRTLAHPRGLPMRPFMRLRYAASNAQLITWPYFFADVARIEAAARSEAGRKRVLERRLQEEGEAEDDDEHVEEEEDASQTLFQGDCRPMRWCRAFAAGYCQRGNVCTFWTPRARAPPTVLDVPW